MGEALAFIKVLFLSIDALDAYGFGLRNYKRANKLRKSYLLSLCQKNIYIVDLSSSSWLIYEYINAILDVSQSYQKRTQGCIGSVHVSLIDSRLCNQ